MEMISNSFYESKNKFGHLLNLEISEANRIGKRHMDSEKDELMRNILQICSVRKRFR